MSLVLHVDGPRWRRHLKAAVAKEPGLVPVAKGNGYGFGLGRLARRAQWLGVDTLAVGTYAEVEAVAARFEGSILVLTPWRDFLHPAYDDRVIHTVSRLSDLELVAAQQSHRPRIVVERATSMLRHGMSAAQLRGAAKVLAAHPDVRLEGVALHLPLAQVSHLAEVDRLMTDVVAAGLPTSTIFVSHLSASELATLRSSFPEFAFRPRIGTDLWLGDRAALRPTATVLDAHSVERGDIYGYRGRHAPAAGTILVVSGGTSHGIGLVAPASGSSLRNRASSVVRGGLDAMGLVRSPYTIDGKQRLFAEPPHMQASMLFLPSGSRVPAIGDEVDVQVRFTTTAFDRVDVT